MFNIAPLMPGICGWRQALVPCRTVALCSPLHSRCTLSPVDAAIQCIHCIDCVATADDSLELEAALFERSEDFETRRPKQIAMPAFPTTTIGSFPQTNGALLWFPGLLLLL